jgi:hypothetical protein
MATPWTKSGALTVKRAEHFTLSPDTKSGSSWKAHLSSSMTPGRNDAADKFALSPDAHDQLADKYAPRGEYALAPRAYE